MIKKLKKNKVEIIYTSTDQQLINNIAAWLKKLTKQAKFSVVKRRLKFKNEYQLKMKYKPTIRAATLIKIGYNLSSWTDHRILLPTQKEAAALATKFDRDIINHDDEILIPDDEFITSYHAHNHFK